MGQMSKCNVKTPIPAAGSCFHQTISDKVTVHYLLSSKQQTDTVKVVKINYISKLSITGGNFPPEFI